VSDEIHFCGMIEPLNGLIAPWRRKRIAYSVQGALPTLSRDQFRAAALEAFLSWSAVCDREFFEDDQNPDILITAGRIDGPLSVLAWSELPDGSDRQLQQKYDATERYVIAIQPPRGSIDLVAVMTHEIGHAIGLDHRSPPRGDLMDPTYSPGRRVPQPGDVERIRGLYGPPGAPPPSDDDRMPATIVILDRQGRETARFKLERVPS